MASRREFLGTVAAAGGMASLGSFGSVVLAQAKGDEKPAPAAPGGPFVLPPLNYPYESLEPHIDKQTMMIHHDKHHQGYVDNLNKAVAGHAELAKMGVDALLADLDKLPTDVRTKINNHGGGHSNHSIFWATLAPAGKGGGEPAGELAKAVTAAFGDYGKFKEAMTKSAMERFGSGWAWLCRSGDGKLLVESFANQDSPITKGLRPLFGIDVWEHAYYLKYQNKRADYVAAIWNIVNWNEVENRFTAT